MNEHSFTTGVFLVRTFVFSILLFAAASVSAHAGGVGLSLTGTSVNWSSPSAASPTFLVGVLNPSGGEPDPVIGWSLGLAVAGAAGSVGTVQFATATQPVSNYLYSYDSAGSVGISTTTTFPASSIGTISDIANDNGIAVPSAGANLLALTFTATSNAYGVFDVFAVPYDGVSNGSYWTDGNDGNTGYPPHDFLNVPSTGGNVLLGTITIPPPTGAATPEPGTIALVGTGMLALAGFCRLRRQSTARRHAS